MHNRTTNATRHNEPPERPSASPPSPPLQPHADHRMKKKNLTILEKKQICQEHNHRLSQGHPASHDTLAQWAKEKFGLPCKPNRSTISRILKCPPPANNVTCNTFRQRRGKDDPLEKALFEWISDCKGKRVHVSVSMLKAKALRLRELSNELLPEEKRNTMKFSDGWVVAFKRRWGLLNIPQQEANEDGDGQVVQREQPSIQSAISSFARKDVFTAVEFALCYPIPSMMTAAATAASNREAKKDHMSVLACANADGSEKLELMIIGKGRSPSSFKKKSAAELGFDYHANRKAWMTFRLFLDWLNRFDSYIAQSQGRKALLLIDNCSAHGNPDTLPKLQHVQVLFLPLDKTSQRQPLQTGVIELLKVRYRLFQMDRALDFVDVRAKDMYKIDILEAMRALKRLWVGIDKDVLKSCWSISGILEPESPTEREVVTRLLASERETLSKQLEQLLPSSTPASVKELLDDGEEKVCVQDVSDEALVANMGSREFDTGNDKEGEDDVVLPCANRLPSIAEQLKAVALTKRIVDSQQVPDDELRHALQKLQAALRCERERIRTSRQTNV